ncbi:hypothetical protein [Wenxinia saemankumensis]|uniref:Membrane protein YjdF n=1 Tax=Wenxinia saemankumensis TaxID=1447782 RepID=A0A1M6EGS6_9RHOB|nr:hypothetical protein [Wenxinia saemankumensis]SHI84674.1 hypothetical protein SAMN05444417_1992 [Wenxinia saemankumensis]
MNPLLLWAIRAVLAVEAVTLGWQQNWLQLTVAVLTLGATFLPDKVARMMGVRLPATFLTLIVLFIFATIFLGEMSGYYERFWWWDLALHFGSAAAFGIFAFLMIFMLFEGDSYAAPPWALAVLSACVAMAIGVVWEIFEYAVDQTLGTNMQKSGLPDTMGDLIVDTLGAILGGGLGYLYLKGMRYGPGALFEEFVGLNRRLYRRIRPRKS